MNEDSRGLRRLTTWRSYVPKFRGKLFEDEDLKRRKIEEFGPRKDPMRLAHENVPSKWNWHAMHLENYPCA